jgi:hypothetical protein
MEKRRREEKAQRNKTTPINKRACRTTVLLEYSSSNIRFGGDLAKRVEKALVVVVVEVSHAPS